MSCKIGGVFFYTILRKNRIRVRSKHPCEDPACNHWRENYIPMQLDLEVAQREELSPNWYDNFRST